MMSESQSEIALSDNYSFYSCQHDHPTSLSAGCPPTSGCFPSLQGQPRTESVSTRASPAEADQLNQLLKQVSAARVQQETAVAQAKKDLDRRMSQIKKEGKHRGHAEGATPYGETDWWRGPKTQGHYTVCPSDEQAEGTLHTEQVSPNNEGLSIPQGICGNQCLNSSRISCGCTTSLKLLRSMHSS